MKRILTIDEITNKVMPIARKYEFHAVYLFGSYARGEATPNSDFDFIVDTSGSNVRSAFQMGGVFNDFEDAFGADNVDLINLGNVILENRVDSVLPSMRENLLKEMVKIYGGE
jgi:predicted nucleotidyltransferase